LRHRSTERLVLNRQAMTLSSRLQYYRRILRAYVTPGESQLTFWHETPQHNPNFAADKLGEYYMLFSAKADYPGCYDAQGIPKLHYHGVIGPQYNPIAIAQWGLGNYNLGRRTGDAERIQKYRRAADWLVENLELNGHGLFVWNHHFNWEYRDTLKAPWYSGLAQGQGISLLVRAHRETGRATYLDAARSAFQSFLHSVENGGVVFTDEHGDVWFEEYIVHPPTHILNGFIWAAWGVYDYWLATRDANARQLFDSAVITLRKNLPKYDFGFWSLYEQSGTRIKMVASPFYHRLHIVQLRIMHQLTGEESFLRFAEQWERYSHNRAYRTRALCYKSVFKLCYY
jgi:heparosan-N-sulfate-glucuronate 5-epimerase